MKVLYNMYNFNTFIPSSDLGVPHQELVLAEILSTLPVLNTKHVHCAFNAYIVLQVSQFHTANINRSIHFHPSPPFYKVGYAVVLILKSFKNMAAV